MVYGEYVGIDVLIDGSPSLPYHPDSALIIRGHVWFHVIVPTGGYDLRG
jgi:hypothetical protein